ncbi:uncharacterized protein LOC128247134 [Octopus bimaculoides]|uniref:uncharacterized protein LOC128247134 n=1 Tax=Octopus bimaculoides TaxID=37653 RepID=UPI0022E163F4|nr:uncharacterized protein LOC128247134 [Octopus bimaculoides]
MFHIKTYKLSLFSALSSSSDVNTPSTTEAASAPVIDDTIDKIVASETPDGPIINTPIGTIFSIKAPDKLKKTVLMTYLTKNIPPDCYEDCNVTRKKCKNDACNYRQNLCVKCILSRR